MKTLRKKLKNSNDLNGLERLLYAEDQKQSLPESITFTTKGYERGMMISISNNKTHYEEIIKRYKDQYLTLLYCLTGENRHTKYDVKSSTGIPDQETLIRLIHRKIPIRYVEYTITDSKRPCMVVHFRDGSISINTCLSMVYTII